MIFLKNFVQKVLPLARRAGEAILSIYHTKDATKVKYKSDASPLTLADQKSNEIICKALRGLEEQFPILSEENKEVPFAERKNYGYYWLVDPLDGTKEFMEKNGEFTVNIALVHIHEVVMGVVYVPCLDEMYWAAKGQGAWLIKNEVAQKLSARTFSLTDSGLRVVCSRSHPNEETQQFVNTLNDPVLIAKGSSLKFLVLAKGEADLYPRLAPTMEWDTAAAQIILEEAGGKVLRTEDRQPLRYNKENLLNPFFVAYGNVK